jgi:hypothetical protein
MDLKSYLNMDSAAFYFSVASISVLNIQSYQIFWRSRDSAEVEFLDVRRNGYYSPPAPPPREQKWVKTVCNLNIVYGNFKSDNSQDYAQKPQRNCTFMNSASGEYVDSDMVHNTSACLLQGQA